MAFIGRASLKTAVITFSSPSPRGLPKSSVLLKIMEALACGSCRQITSSQLRRQDGAPRSAQNACSSLRCMSITVSPAYPHDGWIKSMNGKKSHRADIHPSASNYQQQSPVEPGPKPGRRMRERHHPGAGIGRSSAALS